MRIGLAFSCFFRLLFGKKLPASAAGFIEGGTPAALAAEAAATPKETPTVSTVTMPTAAPSTAAKATKADRDALMKDGALGLMAILQEEGRLVDFLREDISGFSDADIGAAARAVHRGCKRVVDSYVTLEPIIPGEEDAQITLPAGFSPQEIRTSSSKPAPSASTTSGTSGILRHHGWRATNVKFPQWADGIDRTVIAPAQVDLN